MPTISVIIPTYTNSVGLRACLKSILDHTNMFGVEVIVVANGAPEEVRAIDRDFPVKLLWFDSPIGYTKATNEGIKASTGDFLVPLNDDCVILGPGWLDILMAPFVDASKWGMGACNVGLTGPMMEWDPNSNSMFLIFFCVMIRRQVLGEIGLLDEVFSPGFGEDTDYCLRAQDAGWEIVQVPSSTGHFLAERADASTLPEWKQKKIWVADFPIFHDGEQTFQNWPGGDELLRRNGAILAEKWNGKVPSVQRAIDTHGWMAPNELRWLAKNARGKKVVVGVGCAHGRSCRAICDHLDGDAVYYAVDHHLGSSGEPFSHGSAVMDEGNYSIMTWTQNLADHWMNGRAKPVRMHSKQAAETFHKLGIKADMVFIDGDHSRSGVTADIADWWPILNEGGLLCGHDYSETQPEWVEVKEVVNETFKDARVAPHTSIWHTTETRRPAVIDVFPFCNELDVLDIRFHELDPVVDRWVIVEGTKTYSGNPKPLHFDLNKDRYAPFLHKVTYIVVDDWSELPEPDGDPQVIIENAWARERWQRDAVMRGLTDCRDNDVIVLGDVDEIPRAGAVAAYRSEQGLCRLKQRLFYCYMNYENKQGWDWLRIMPYSVMKDRTPCGVRYPPDQLPVIEDGGWHFSFMGGPSKWLEKLANTAHQEYNTATYRDPERMKAQIAIGKDILFRDELNYEFVPVDESYPRFVTDHLQRFRDNEFITEEFTMHRESAQFIERVKSVHSEFFKGKKVMEAGSLDVNGSVRSFFKECDYVGIDLATGKGVDVVTPAALHLRPGAYDVVVSSEMLEHDSDWEASLKQMYENLKPGGLFVLSCAGPSRPEHGTARTDTYSSPFTTGYYRNVSREDFLRVLPAGLFDESNLDYGRGQEDLNFFGIKRTAETMTVTVEVSTKDRYTTTLPMCLASAITQTRKPERLVIYDDGEQKDLREMSPFNGLLKMADEAGIKWEIFATPRQGQVANHQHALDNAQTDLMLRVDDDCVLEPNVIEELLKAMADPNVGAAAPLIHHPGNVRPLPENVTGAMADIGLGFNMQWFSFNGSMREAEHLYSSFMYRVEAAKKAGGYPRGLSQVGHREETIFSHAIKRAGYRVVVTPYAKMWHLREPTGGIRSFKDQGLWAHDEEFFQKKMAEWGIGQRKRKVIVLDCGLGDHYAFRTVLPGIREAHKDKELVLAVCYEEVFKGEDIPLISIADAKLLVGEDLSNHSIYKWMWDRDWQKPLAEAFREMHA